MTVIHYDFRKKETDVDQISVVMDTYDQFIEMNKNSFDQLRTMIHLLLIENKNLKEQVNARYDKTR